MAIQSYKELVAWQKSIQLVKSTSLRDRSPRMRCTASLRRAAVSIPSNIAEGQGRLSTGEFRQFLGQARGSLFELESQVLIAENLNYLNTTEAKTLDAKITEVARILNGLLKSLDRAKLSTIH